MPLTPFQRETLSLLARHRSPESYLAGGAVLNRSETSPRFSADLDIFHDVAESVLSSAEADAAVLMEHGYALDWLIRQPYLQQARVRRQGQELRLDWCYDSAFRFFPVLADAEFGYRLHQADLATNKVLALAGRQEIRDFLDVLYLHQTYLSLGAIAWAACGKDQGFTPWSLLEMTKRHVKFRNGDLEKGDIQQEHLARPLSLTDLKVVWVQALEEAEAWLARLPIHEVGCLYLGADGEPLSVDPQGPDFTKCVRHFGSLRGAWPTIAG